MNPTLITTCDNLPNYEVTCLHGLVEGMAIRSRIGFGNIGRSIKEALGREQSGLKTFCSEARSEARHQLWTLAQELGANAVIGIRYDMSEISPGVTEICCYGTAVSVERIGSKQPPSSLGR